MFKFNFSGLELEEESNATGDNTRDRTDNAQTADLSNETDGVCSQGRVEIRDVKESRDSMSYKENIVEARELALDELAQSLPPAFSYSPITVPILYDSAPSLTESTSQTQRPNAPAKSITLFRRDLFDVRYQLISEANEDVHELRVDGTRAIDELQQSRVEIYAEIRKAADALKFIDNPSDLVPDVYEGGLKTWECALDLVDCLETLTSEKKEGTDWIRGKRVIELGCGTAVPTLYLLHTLFSHPQSMGVGAEYPWTEFVLQDYNELVLRLVTFPNVLLQWYTSPLAEAYRSNYDEELFDAAVQGDLQVTPELISAFRASLQKQRISVYFISGSWQSLASDESPCTFPFNVTLTSETIYQTSSLPPLIALLRRASQGSTQRNEAETPSLLPEDNVRLCLVAAKVLYFGVGGGVMEFERAVLEAGGKTSVVLERNVGVGRKVLRIGWP